MNREMERKIDEAVEIYARESIPEMRDTFMESYSRIYQYTDQEISLVERLREAYQKRDYDMLRQIPIVFNNDYNTIAFIHYGKYPDLSMEESFYVPFGNETTGEHAGILLWFIDEFRKKGVVPEFATYISDEVEKFKKLRDNICFDILSSDSYKAAVASAGGVMNKDIATSLREVYANEEFQRQEQVLELCDLAETNLGLQQSLLFGLREKLGC